MEYHVVIEGEFASLNEFIDANRRNNGRWNKGNQMKQKDQNIISAFLKKQLHGIHIDVPVELEYNYYCRNKKKDKDNISGYFHKVFQDALVQCGIIHNDSWYYITGFSDYFFVDNKNPRIEIIVKETT